MGFAPACPSATYDDVMESMTDCAFSWPISARRGSYQLRAPFVPVEEEEKILVLVEGGRHVVWGRGARW